MSELSTQIAAALDAGGDTGETPAPAPAPAPAVETETSQPQETETAPEVPEGERADFLGDEKFDWSQVPPEQLPALKGFQKSYTQKMQEIAEQRKQLETVDPGALQWAQYVRGLAQTNPAAAAELLRREAEGLAANTPAAPNPYEQQQYASEGERFLAERLQKAEQVLQQQEVARHTAEIDRRFAETETAYSTKIPFEDRQRVCQFCLQNNIPDVGMGWKVMNYDRALQVGRDQASRVVTQKAGMPGPPAGVANREEPTVREPKSVKEALEMALDEAA